MSLVASILFSVILAGDPLSQLPAIWVGTTIKNFPMSENRFHNLVVFLRAKRSK